jgi:hypothetical protein
MASSINASLTAGIVQTADTSGNLNLQSGGTTIVAITSSGAAITGALSASGATTFPAGSAAAPAITTTGDTNTGIFFPAADTIAFAEGGVEAMRIHSSGGVSIGNTTDPGATNLSVTGSVASGSVSTGAISGSTVAASTSVAVNSLSKIVAANTGSIAAGGTYVITLAPITSGQLNIYIQRTDNGNFNTRTLYFASNRYGSNVAITSVASTNGSTGAAPFSVSTGVDGSSNQTVTITNTHGSLAINGTWTYSGLHTG